MEPIYQIRYFDNENCSWEHYAFVYGKQNTINYSQQASEQGYEVSYHEINIKNYPEETKQIKSNKQPKQMSIYDFME